MSDSLQELVGRRVSYWTNSGSSSTGTLQNVGTRWISLAEDTGVTVLLPAESIRLLKVTGGGMTAQPVTGELNPSLLGRSVTIATYGSENKFSDTGELEAFDDNWLRIRKKNDQLYFPISSIAELRLL